MSKCQNGAELSTDNSTARKNVELPNANSTATDPTVELSIDNSTARNPTVELAIGNSMFFLPLNCQLTIQHLKAQINVAPNCLQTKWDPTST